MKIDKNHSENHYELINVRNKSELFFDKYNHTMSFLRTLFGLLNVFLSILIALKVFQLMWGIIIFASDFTDDIVKPYKGVNFNTNYDR